MLSSLKELKSSTMFSKRVGIVAALNYENALGNSMIWSLTRMLWYLGGDTTYPLRNESQALQVTGCNRIEVVDSPANHQPGYHDENLVGQVLKQCHGYDSQVRMEVRSSI